MLTLWWSWWLKTWNAAPGRKVEVVKKEETGDELRVRAGKLNSHQCTERRAVDEDALRVWSQ